MSGPRRRVFASHTITTKALIAIIFSLIAVASLSTLLTLPRALAASIVSDDFNDNSIDTAKWNPNDLFSGFTNTNVPIAETLQHLEIGPLLQNVDGSSYRGVRTVNTYNFSGAYSYVELVQAANSNTAGDAMFTIWGTFQSVQRVTQIQSLLSWIDSTLTGGLPVYILGDLNLTIDTPKQPSGFQFDLFTQAGFGDLWQTGLSNGLAEANWGDRDQDSIPDMPLGLNTRTADARRIDYILYKPNNGSISLLKISVPDGRASCPQPLENDGGYLACPSVSPFNPVQRWDIPEDQGVRLSDHNWIWVELGF